MPGRWSRALKRLSLAVGISLLVTTAQAQTVQAPTTELVAAYGAYREARESDQQGALEQGLEVLERAEAEGLAQEERAALRLELAELALEIGRPERALAVLMPLIEAKDYERPSTSRVYELAAQAQLALGNSKHAQSMLSERYRALATRYGERSTVLSGTLSRLIELAESNGEADLAARLRLQMGSLDDTVVLKPKGEDQNNATPREVFYGTNRARTGDDAPTYFYGSERSEDVQLGVVEVKIPHTHRIGNLEVPSWWRLQFEPDPEFHFLIEPPISTLDRTAFLKAVDDFRSQLGENDGLLFIPGYSTSFEMAAFRAAQLAYDIEFEGPVFLFSWPSRDHLAGYIPDAGGVAESAPDIMNFLRLLSKDAGIERLHVIAHSMGSRYLLEAIKRYHAAYPQEAPFGHVVLAAPDLDVDVLEDRLAEAKAMSERVTLYSATDDVMLWLSMLYNRERRAGGELVVLPGLDTIDATSVESDLTGHSYMAESELVLADLIGLLNIGWDPTWRCTLVPAATEESAQEDHWRIHVNGCSGDQLRAALRLIRKYGLSPALVRAQQALETAEARDKVSEAFWLGVIEVFRQLERNMARLNPDRP